MNLTEANRLAHSVLAQYNVPNTTIEWDNARSRAGVCKFTRNRHTQQISKRVIFSRLVFKAMPDEEQVDTILHEIAHARLPHTVGHGPEWVAIHRAMGGKGNAVLKSSEIAAKVALWEGRCIYSREVLARRNRLTEKSRRLICLCHRERLNWINP